MKLTSETFSEKCAFWEISNFNTKKKKMKSVCCPSHLADSRCYGHHGIEHYALFAVPHSACTLLFGNLSRQWQVEVIKT